MNSKKYRDLEKMIATIRKEYHFGKLDRGDLSANPFEQFARWFTEAVKHRDKKANVMVLATAGEKTISTRSVLLKGFNEKGFIFYSNIKSRKVRELKENPRASVCFYWAELEKQVTVSGRVKEMGLKETEIYFRSRPREAQIATWCTEQNRVLQTRKELDLRFERMRKKFEGREIPLNLHWKGFRLEPQEFEFWQGRANRLNDRFRYRRRARGWLIERLEP